MKQITKTDLAQLEPSPLYVSGTGDLREQKKLKSIPDTLSERARYRADAEAISGFIRYYTGFSREAFREMINELAVEWLVKEFDFCADPERVAYQAMAFAEVRGWWRIKWNERDKWLVDTNAGAFEKSLRDANGDIESIRHYVTCLYKGYHRSWLYEDKAYGEALSMSYAKLWS